jgi:hypothetical protein
LTTAALRLVPVGNGDLDAAVGALPAVRLVRAAEGVFLCCAAELAGVARMLLARAGIDAEACIAAPTPPPGWLPARAPDLAPLPRSACVDALELRAIGTGEATERLLRRGPLGRLLPFVPRPDIAPVRAVLHGEDRVIGWRRVLWADRAVFRTPALRGVRPSFFDREAVARGEERLVLVGSGAIARWIRA